MIRTKILASENAVMRNIAFGICIVLFLGSHTVLGTDTNAVNAPVSHGSIDTNVTLLAEVEKTEFAPLEPIAVKLSLLNRGDLMRVLSYGPDIRAYAVSIKHQSGIEMPLTQYGKGFSHNARRFNEDLWHVFFHHDGWHGRPFVLNWIYDMTLPGHYSATFAWVPEPMDTTGALSHGVPRVVSNRLELEVKGRALPKDRRGRAGQMAGPQPRSGTSQRQ